jgi:hypothetical protein
MHSAFMHSVVDEKFAVGSTKAHFKLVLLAIIKINYFGALPGALKA